MIEGPKNVNIKVMKEGSYYIESNNTNQCKITKYGLKILKGDPKKLTMHETSGQINVIVSD